MRRQVTTKQPPIMSQSYADRSVFEFGRPQQAKVQLCGQLDVQGKLPGVPKNTFALAEASCAKRPCRWSPASNYMVRRRDRRQPSPLSSLPSRMSA
jgi:hypothetical protein